LPDTKSRLAQVVADKALPSPACLFVFGCHSFSDSIAFYEECLTTILAFML